jgi:RNA polymerase sigma-70 factor, ECF subfamily
VIGTREREHSETDPLTEALLPLPSMADSPDEAPRSPEVAEVRAPARESAADAARFRSMVDDHFDFIWRSLRGLGIATDSADDAAQHVFWVASQKVASIDVGAERSFLFSTALGVAANLRRARARDRVVLDEAAVSAQPDDAPGGEQLVEMTERRALLDEVLASMPHDLRTVFVLFVLEGADTPQIAALLGIAQGTVASRLRRARESFHTLSRRLQARTTKRGGTR